MSFCKFCEHFEQTPEKMDDQGLCHCPDDMIYAVNGSDDSRNCVHFEHVTTSTDVLLNAEGYITSPAGHSFGVTGCKALLKVLREFEFTGKGHAKMRVLPHRFGGAFQSVTEKNIIHKKPFNKEIK